MKLLGWNISRTEIKFFFIARNPHHLYTHNDFENWNVYPFNPDAKPHFNDSVLGNQYPFNKYLLLKTQLPLIWCMYVCNSQYAMNYFLYLKFTFLFYFWFLEFWSSILNFVNENPKIFREFLNPTITRLIISFVSTYDL